MTDSYLDEFRRKVSENDYESDNENDLDSYGVENNNEFDNDEQNYK